MKNILTFLFLSICLSVNAQNFEGIINYKMEMINPNPEMISDSIWDALIKEQFGEKGYAVQKYYYQKENYKSELISDANKLTQLFNPKDKLLYSWQQKSQDATTIDSRKSMDEFVSLTFEEGQKDILGITCNKVVIKSSMSEITIWYNPAKLKMDKLLYKGHIYGHWEQTLNAINCLPLQIEVKSAFMHMTQTVTSIEKKKLKKETFKLPTFDNVSKSIIN